MENHLCPSSPSPFTDKILKSGSKPSGILSNLPFKTHEPFGGWVLWRWRGELCGLTAPFAALPWHSCCTTRTCAHMTYKHSKSHAQLQSSQLVQHITMQQAKASYFPAILPKAIELEQSYTLPGPPPCRTQNRSQLKKKFSAYRSLHTGISTLRTSEVLCSWATEALVLICHQILPGLITVFLSINSGPVQEHIFAGSPSVTRTSKWVLCMH